MVALIVVLAVLLLLAVIPVGVDGGYTEDAARLSIKIGPLRWGIYPLKERQETEEQRADRLARRAKKKLRREEKQRKKEKTAPPETASAEKKKLNIPQLTELAKLGFHALNRFRRHLCVDYFRLYWTAAAANPYDAAMQFGAVSAAMGTLDPLAKKAVHVRRSELRVETNFDRETPAVDTWITMTIRIWEVFWVGLAFGTEFLIWKWRHREKKAGAERKEDNGKKQNR